MQSGGLLEEVTAKLSLDSQAGGSYKNVKGRR